MPMSWSFRWFWLLPCLAFGEPTCDAKEGSCEEVAMVQRQIREHTAGGSHLNVSTAGCKGFKCERGHPAWGATSAHSHSHAHSGYSSGFAVNMDGSVKTFYLPGATILNGASTVQYGVNDKYYLMKSDTTDYANPANFEMVKLAGKTMVTTIDLHGANCGCNVNFFLVSMPAGPAGQYNDHYCDANCVGGNCCAEFDINEMNDHALQITNHNCYGTPSKGSCDGDGNPMMRFGPPEYGPGSWYTIDTTKPFQFALQISEEIVGENSPDNHLIVYARLWQDGKTLKKSFGGVGSSINSQWKNLADGMVLVVDYWKSNDLTWLDGNGCGYGHSEYCSSNRADLSNMAIISNDLETEEDCPTPGDCKCDWFHKGMALDDDGSECWCRCGGCHVSPLVPRCTWSGYKPKWAAK